MKAKRMLYTLAAGGALTLTGGLMGCEAGPGDPGYTADPAHTGDPAHHQPAIETERDHDRPDTQQPQQQRPGGMQDQDQEQDHLRDRDTTEEGVDPAGEADSPGMDDQAY